MFEDFETIKFPPSDEALAGLPQGGCIYVFFMEKRSKVQPFYVGQTRRLAARMEDYVAGSFDAPTDFRVCEAARYLEEEKQCRILVRYKPSRHPREDEHALIRELQLEGIRLLNDFVSYDYRTAKRRQERRYLRRFCDVLFGSEWRTGLEFGTKR